MFLKSVPYPVTLGLHGAAAFCWPAGAVASEPAVLALFSGELRVVRAELQGVRSALAAIEPLPVGQTAPQLGHQHLQLKEPPPVAPWVQFDFRGVERFDRIVLVPAQVDYRTGDRGPYGFPRRFRVDASNDPTFAVFQSLFVQTESDFQVARLVPIVADFAAVEARYVRLTVTRLAEENGWHSFALAEFMALQGDINIAHGAEVSAEGGVSLPPRWNKDYLVDGRTPLGPPIRRAALAEFDALFAGSTAREPVPWMAVDLGTVQRIDEVRLHPLHSWQGADVPGFRFPLRFRVEVSDDVDFSDARVLAESPAEDFSNPGNNPVTVRGPALAGRHVRVLALKVVPSARGDFALSELEVSSGGRNVALGCPVSTSDYPGGRSGVPRPPALLTDGLTSLGRLLSLRAWLDDWRGRTELETRAAALEARLPDLETRAMVRAGLTAGSAVLLGVAGVAGFSFLARRRRRIEQRTFRQKLAQDLHDEVGSNLAAIAVLSETAALQSPAAGGDVGEIHRLARESAEAMREVLWLVDSYQQGGLDLAAHFRLVAARLLPRSEVKWREPPENIPDHWPVQVRREIFLLFKESLANVARHAQATRIELSARLLADRFELLVADNGRGFDPGQPPRGSGLSNLRARAAAVAGEIEITSTPGRGTRIHLRVPAPALH
jgi:signal transduction histidine kinase